MADNAILFKLVAKSVGMKYGITPTFMAKPYSDVSDITPVSGNSTRRLWLTRADARNLWVRIDTIQS